MNDSNKPSSASNDRESADAPAPLPAHRTCATDDMDRMLLASSPEYANNRKQLQEAVASASFSIARAEARGIVTIPVVVHVVWKLPEENISIEQINSQIDVLNRDFRKQNPDTSQVPEIWQPLVTDARIEFKLATTDPNGNPTNGITRTKSNKVKFRSRIDEVKFSSNEGADAWPSDRYLNIWVCRQIDDGVLGYAQFPGGPPEKDGVVILTSAFGTTGTATAPFNLGRTATHEIGHWLNLKHIWGDDGGACGGSDEVNDTPNQGDHNFGKPTYPHISCNNAPHGDMFMNYMDYVDDETMFMFTKDQVVRMDACLTTARSSFLNQPMPV